MKRLARAIEALQLMLFDESTPPAIAEPATRQSLDAAPRSNGSAPAGTAFRHPRAQRELRLGEHLVAYELRRARRRSIGFVVGVDGLSVAAPRWVGQGDIDAALREKSAWILRKLVEQRERAERHAAARVEWRDGTCLPFLGGTVIVTLDARATGAVLDAAAGASVGAAVGSGAGAGAGSTGPLRLRLGLPASASPEQIRDAVQSWLQRQARRVFEERCAIYAARLGVRVKRLSLSSAQTRWGSASVDGSVRLNWRLIHFGLPTIDYVVAHELAHLRHMDHSPQFWDVVRSVMPDYEQKRSVLKDSVLPGF